MGRLTKAFLVIVLNLGIVYSSPSLASSHFDAFERDIKPLGFFTVYDLKKIYEYQYSFENDSFGFWVLSKAIANGRSDIQKLLRESDRRVETFIDEAKKASQEASRRRREARFVSIVSSFVNLTRATIGFARSVEQMESKSRMSELEKLYGDNWQGVEESFESLRKNDLMLFKDFDKDKFGRWVGNRDGASTILDRSNVSPDLAKVTRIGENLDWLDSTLENRNLIDEGTFSEAQKRIREGYELLYSMSPTDSDNFVDENRITLESAVADLVPTSLKDANLAEGIANGLLFIFDSQPVGDGTQLGYGARLFMAEELNRYSRIFFADQYDLELGGFIPYLESIEPQILDQIECADQPCMFSQ